MAEYLTTAGSSSEIEKLIINSKDKLYLITPFMQLNKLLKPQLEQLDNRESTIDIRVVSRTDKINADDLAFLQKLKNVKIFTLDNLHAKCYINQDTAIVTSLNLYDFSQQNNIEMGIKVEKDKDAELYQNIYNGVDSIIRQSKKYDLKLVEKENQKVIVKEPIKKIKPESGFCIRCGHEIELNPDRPLCNTCYQSWAKYGDTNYPEKYCHVCGRETNQSYNKPICYSCYKKVK